MCLNMQFSDFNAYMGTKQVFHCVYPTITVEMKRMRKHKLNPISCRVLQTKL